MNTLVYFYFEHVCSSPLHSFFDLFPYTQSSLQVFSWSFINRYPINTYTAHELYSKDSFGKTLTWFPNPTNLAGVWSSKFNNENTTALYDICSRFTKRHQNGVTSNGGRYNLFIVIFEQILHIALVFLLLTWNE